MADYNGQSPYADTPVYGNGLDMMEHRNIPKLKEDVLYEIDSVYHNRPDLLSFDLYGTANLWWVFAARNPNVIKDPIFDFYAGRKIYIPLKANLEAALA